MKIVHLDPALKNNQGELSHNLGDQIISGFVQDILKEIFPKSEIKRFATHAYPSAKEKKLIRNADFCFLGGSNLLNSTVNLFNNWKVDRGILDTILGRSSRAISLGLGWGAYQEAPNWRSRMFYKKHLRSDLIHSLRDGYSLNHFNTIGGLEGINTGCPSTWQLNATSANRKTRALPESCVFTFTDYHTSPDQDQALLDVLLNHFKDLVYFPQGKDDEVYLKKHPLYKKNSRRFLILPHDLTVFHDTLKAGEIVYVGTRLHAGILALSKNVESLIIGIDNRAKEIQRDIFLPVADRADMALVKRWLQGEMVFEQKKILLNLSAITKWKTQFFR